MIEINKIIENKDKDEIDLKKIYQFKSGHNDIIVSLSELKNKRNKKLDEENNNNEIILVSASMDKNLKFFKIKN